MARGESAPVVIRRPKRVTAGTVVIGTFVILLDPIFQGLALSLMGGTLVSTGLTLVIVPLLYYMVERKNYEEEAVSDQPSASN